MNENEIKQIVRDEIVRKLNKFAKELSGVERGMMEAAARFVGDEKSPPSPSITPEMVQKGAEALRGRVATTGCTCPWDATGTPPPTCTCRFKAEQELREYSRWVLEAALK